MFDLQAYREAYRLESETAGVRPRGRWLLCNVEKETRFVGEWSAGWAVVVGG